MIVYLFGWSFKQEITILVIRSVSGREASGSSARAIRRSLAQVRHVQWTNALLVRLLHLGVRIRGALDLLKRRGVVVVVTQALSSSSSMLEPSLIIRWKRPANCVGSSI
jgi:hypothetical protein